MSTAMNSTNTQMTIVKRSGTSVRNNQKSIGNGTVTTNGNANTAKDKKYNELQTIVISNSPSKMDTSVTTALLSTTDESAPSL